MYVNATVLQPNEYSVCAQTRSSGAGGKHPHTVYSHCNERMLLIMKKEDGSSLRRTHPHITRSVKKGLVIVASPACALSLASLISLIKHSQFTRQTLSIYSYQYFYAEYGGFKYVAVYQTSPPSIINPILFWYQLRTDCREGENMSTSHFPMHQQQPRWLAWRSAQHGSSPSLTLNSNGNDLVWCMSSANFSPGALTPLRSDMLAGGKHSNLPSKTATLRSLTTGE